MGKSSWLLVIVFMMFLLLEHLFGEEVACAIETLRTMSDAC